MNLTKGKYQISYAALKKLDILINYNLENIDKYVQELETGKVVKININDYDIMLSKPFKQWACSGCRKGILAIELQIGEYNFCPHCGIGLEWVE
jgi:hypothetical protein